jgi:predicted DNA binding CopG/RHH family protein
LDVNAQDHKERFAKICEEIDHQTAVISEQKNLLQQLQDLNQEATTQVTEASVELAAKAAKLEATRLDLIETQRR